MRRKGCFFWSTLAHGAQVFRTGRDWIADRDIDRVLADLKRPRQGASIVVGREESFEWTYLERILAVNGDSTGKGDMPMEVLQSNASLPVGLESHVKFTLQSKNEIYTTFDNALFRNPGDPLGFSYAADLALAAEFEDQMTSLIREYKGNGDYLSPHHPDEQGAKVDAPDSTALMSMPQQEARLAISYFSDHNVLFQKARAIVFVELHRESPRPSRRLKVS